MSDATEFRPRPKRSAVLLCLCLTTWSTSYAQDPSNPFSDVIAASQRRMVKVYGATAGRVEGYSSGLLVSEDGLIVTMQGVYLDGGRVQVTFSDGEQVPATVLKRDRDLQLALLKVSRSTPDYFVLHESDVGQKGDWVVALSNAFKVADGVEPMSVNLGIISLRSTIEARLNERDVAYRGPIVVLDAITSNPGAGGGAVVAADGRLVGTIGRVISSSETNTRLNYAVPSSAVKAFVEGRLTEVAAQEEPGTRKKADLGIKLFELGGRGAPAYIDRVIKDGPAASGGLRPDDLVISIAGESVGNIREFNNVLDSLRPGQDVILVVKRNQELIRVPLVAAERK